MCQEIFLFLLFFGGVWIGLMLILKMFSKIHQWNLVSPVKYGPGSLEGFDYQPSLLLDLLKICWDFLFLLESVLVICIFLEIFLFCLDYLFCWHTIVHSILLCSIVMYSTVTFPLSFLVLTLITLPFKGLPILTFPKNWLLLLLVFLRYSLCHLFLLWSFMISFLLLALGLLCSSFSRFKVKAKLLIYDFSSF